MSESIEKKIVKPPKLIGSCRFALALLCFCASVLFFFMRYNFAMAMVCMTGTLVNSTDPGYIEGEFTWDKDIVANLLGAFFYGYVATLILGGFLTDRYGTKIPLFWGMMSMSITSLLIPSAARLHWAYLMVIRIFQGLASGFTMPVLYTIFNIWGSKEERSTLMAITFSGTSIASIINYPASALLCQSGVDNGWPLIFYIPGALTFAWCFIYWFFATESPEDHPRISEEEKLYLRYNSVKNEGASHDNQEGPLKVPWKDMLLSLPVHALWITHFSAVWSQTLLALNLPFYINETFDLGIVYNGLLCALPYVGTFLMNFSGKLYDYINMKSLMTTTTLSKVFNSIGFFVSVVVFCILSKFNYLQQIMLLTFSSTIFQLANNGGYFITHDMAGPFSGLLYGITNTLAQMSGVVNPLVVAALAPEGTDQEWQNVFYVGAVITGIGGIVYLLFASRERQPWSYEQQKVDQKVDVV